MKKTIIIALISVILASGSPLFAQDKSKEGKDSEYYYVSVSLEKIFPYRKGYIVQYRKGLHQLVTAYLPSEWFTYVAGKGEILNLPRGNAWPSMSIYYKEGEFSHVRLYVHPQASHQTWGNVPQNVNIDDRFEGIEKIDL